MRACVLSRFSHATLWAVASHASLTMGFSRQEYWSGLVCTPQGVLLDPGVESTPPASVGGLLTTRDTWEAQDRERKSKQNLQVP